MAIIISTYKFFLFLSLLYYYNVYKKIDCSGGKKKNMVKSISVCWNHKVKKKLGKGNTGILEFLLAKIATVVFRVCWEVPLTS